MLNLADIDQAVLLARGKYSSVRAALEDSKKDLQMLCGKMTSVSSQVLRKMQPDYDAAPDSVADLMEIGRNTLQMMEATANQIESLARQKAELKPKAWPK